MNLLRPRDRDVVANGVRLHLLDWGGEGRTPLLLLHGFTGHAHAWDTLSIALQPHFHVYALEWDRDRIGVSVDGREYFAFARESDDRRVWPFDGPFHLLLNVAVGGNWPGNPDATTQFPQTMKVDYVRVYRLVTE